VQHEAPEARPLEDLGAEEVAPVDREQEVDGLAPQRLQLGLVQAAGDPERGAEALRGGAGVLEEGRLARRLGEAEDDQLGLGSQLGDPLEATQPARGGTADDDPQGLLRRRTRAA
jgi:hypothetical protein